MKIIILFPPGCYGSFIAQVLLHAHSDDVLFINDNGNTHISNLNADIRNITSVGEVNNFLDSSYSICLYHPDNSNTLFDLFKIAENKCKIVNIGYNYSSKLWILDNQFTKITNDWFYSMDSSFSKFMKAWGDHPINDYETWQLREGLSMYIPNIESNECVNSMTFNNTNNFDWGFYIDITDLRDRFVETISKLCDYCNIAYNQTTLNNIYDTWAPSQKHFFKDSIANTISNNILNNIDFTIDENLTIVDEAYIQYKLRSAGAELRCYGLNVFPKSNAEFQNLIYYKYDTLIANNFNDILTRVYNKQISHNDALKTISTILGKLE